MSFGDRLKKARKDKKLTQEEVAEIIGIDDTTISKYENDKSEPDKDILNKLCDLYGVKTDYIYGRETKEGKEKTPLSDIDRRILEGVKQLPEERKEEVLNFIDFSLKKREGKKVNE